MFGLWHILPGIAALESASGIAEVSTTGADIGLVAVQVLVTGPRRRALPLGTWHRRCSSMPLNSVPRAIGRLAVQNTWF